MISIAACKTNFDNCQAEGDRLNGIQVAWGGGADKAMAYGNVASVWGMLYIERSRFEKQGITPSAAAVVYGDRAEALLNKAMPKMYNELAVAASYANLASNAAFLFAEQVRVDNTTKAV